jgi:uncharacterized protein (DUF433 family)
MAPAREAEINDPFRTGKAYTSAEAARLAGTTAATVRRWLLGYDAPGHHMEPVFGGRERPGTGEVLQVSFLELIEVLVAARFRIDEKVSLKRIRAAHEFARKELLIPFPFASLEFVHSGGHLMHRFEDAQPGPGHMAFDLHGQWALPEDVQDAFDAVEFDEGPRIHFASRFYPFGRTTPVVVDPHYAAGRPIVSGTRITISTIAERFRAGDSIGLLADDYDLETSAVEEVLRLAS